MRLKLRHTNRNDSYLLSVNCKFGSIAKDGFVEALVTNYFDIYDYESYISTRSLLEKNYNMTINIIKISVFSLIS